MSSAIVGTNDSFPARNMIRVLLSLISYRIIEDQRKRDMRGCKVRN